MLASGETEDYDAVILCTGGRPVVPSAFADRGIHVLRRQADSVSLVRAWQGCDHITVVGMGFIGAEVATAARQLNIGVTVVEGLEIPFSSRFGPEVGERITALHRDAGVVVRSGVAVASVRGGVGDHELHLVDGQVISTGLVVAGTGAVAELSLIHI